VVDLQPGGADLRPGARGPEGNTIAMAPRNDRVHQYPLQVTGYARTFEANVIARLYQGGELVAENVTTAAAWAETWGAYALTIDQGPSGDVELFVGTESARDGSEQGVRIPLTIGQEGSGDPGNGNGATTYVVQSGDTLYAIA